MYPWVWQWLHVQFNLILFNNFMEMFGPWALIRLLKYLTDSKIEWTFPSEIWKTKQEMIVSILKNLNECDHQPAADFTPQLTGAYFHKNLHVLQHRKPGQKPLLGDGLNRAAGITLSSSIMNINVRVGQRVGRSPWTRSISGLCVEYCRWAEPGDWRQNTLKNNLNGETLAWPEG